ncbi:amino acid/polyamine/organocation transporter, APC superfamily [Mycoplasmopsis agassizii]|uniref:Amino acid permease n=2 Tax=Mycoplasmopsis agassizii TaxID=33922 RepID=A0ABX4H4I1_9BACT|nr:amino acid permease [Mycoplasmopsis agassizii]SMC19260.1 amino acid/polyamine/organocation transporter, APC superfamily [Mycoplasmopsis agassizii]
MQKIKQISYMSALIIIIGSTIGAGIFFKNRNIARYAQGDLGFIIASWIIAAVGVIFLALALIEVSSVSRDDKGFLAWIKKFNYRFFSRYTSSYMLLISLPLQFLTLPLFVVQTLQDAGGFQLNGWFVALIALGIFLWLSFMNFYSLRAGETLAWFFTFLKYIPLVVAPIIAYVASGNAAFSNQIPLANRGSLPSGSLSSYSRWLGLLAAMPSIIFVYDGFYTTTSLRSNLKNKNSLGWLMVIAIAIVTATYLFLTIAFGIGTSSGTIGGIYEGAVPNWVVITMNVLVSMSILGLINNQVMSLPRIYRVSLEEKEFYFLKWFHDLFKFKSTRNSAFAFFITIVLSYFAVCVPIGLYALTSSSGADYGQLAANLYDIADLITGFSSLVIFFWLAWALVGALRNRWTNKVEVKKSKFFIPTAIIGSIFVFLSVGYFTLEAIVNMFATDGSDQVNAIIKFVFFVFTLVAPLIVVLIENENKKFWAWNQEKPTFSLKTIFSKKIVTK